MKRKIFFGWIIALSMICSVSAQQADSQQKRRYVVVPADQVLVTIVYQPECPLQFEDAKALVTMEGSHTSGYVIRNRGTKPIRSFTIGIPGATITRSEEFTKRLFMPGERTPGDQNIEIVPLSDELRDKLKLNGPMKTFVIFMVIRVEYADGTVYSAESTYQALQKYTDELIELQANRKSQ